MSEKIITEIEWFSPSVKPPPLSFILARIQTQFDDWVEIVGYDGVKFNLPARTTEPEVTLWAHVPTFKNK